MQNKIQIFFIIILNIFISSSAFGETQLNFDVSQIEILDGGDKIIGNKRGTISTNDGIIIDADEFEYDKNKNILQATGNINIQDKINNYQISSESIIYFKNTEKIVIKGKSNSFTNSNYNLKAEDITFFRKEMLISSDKGATLVDEKNETFYEINKFSYSFKDQIVKGEKIFVNINYNQPFSDKYFFKSAIINLEDQSYIAQDIDINLKKDIFGNENNDPRFKGISSSSNDGITTKEKGINTSCKKNDSCPPWTIQAEKVTYDENKKQIFYDNALIKFMTSQ